jgi:hypothetical protein
MSKELYIGVSGNARQAVNMYVGVGGVARKVRSAFVGDGEGKARLFFGVPWQPGIITPDNMTSDNAPSPYRAKSRSNWNATYSAWCCFTAANRFVAGGGGTMPTGSDIPADGEWWTEVDLGEPRFANKGRLKTSENNVGRVWPGEFEIRATNDDTAWDDNLTSDKWAVVGSVTGYTQPNANYTWAAEFTLGNPGYYRYYRVRVTRGAWAASVSNSHNTIGQVELSAE